jgi:uncharacterized protein YfaS (alpha-2-macroglobulin family)
VDYLEWQEETKSHFSLTVLIDSVLVFVHEFNPSNIFKTFTEVIPMDALPKEKFAAVTFVREHRNDERNRWYYDMSLKYFVPTESLPPRDEGITITRELYALTDTGYAEPLHKVQVGDVVKGKITLVVPGPYTDLAVEDFIPAGFEIVNMNLATEDQSLDDSDETEDVYYDDYGVQVNNERSLANTVNSLRAFVGGSLSTEDFRAQGLARRSQSHKDVLRPSHVESHDDRVFAYIERLTPGVYEYTYYLRALVPGTFQQLPARAEVLYFPEVFGRTFGNIITVVE